MIYEISMISMENDPLCDARKNPEGFLEIRLRKSLRFPWDVSGEVHLHGSEIFQPWN